MKPQRIQRKRIKGWRKPDNTVNVTRPGQWGNPFKIGDPGIETASLAIVAYRHWLEVSPKGRVILKIAKKLLKGKNLMCFCDVGKPCHGDILLEIVNQ